MFARPPSLNSALFRAGTLSRNLSLNGSTTFEPMRQVLAYRLTMFSTDIPVKSFAHCLNVHVQICSGLHDFRLPVTWRISVVPLLDGWGCLCLGGR